MLLYILKSGACLALFLAFYKIFLEKENMHGFKRFYLLAGLLLAFTIPLVTFVEYVEVPFVSQVIEQPSAELTAVPITSQEQDLMEYLPVALWSIYFLGLFLFGFKFIKNFSEIIIKIKKNPKFKINGITNVLLKQSIAPHTFFSYIFLNKHKFEAKQIPQEVLLHEETHAKQKHSVDVLFIELLQVLFWFNPLIHLTKKAIKLNHEFLADKAVIKNGIQPNLYQQILLEFSSNSSEPLLANAINYSSIKKRFTVMRTKTTKTSILLRSLLLLPMAAILLYSFSSKETKEILVEAEQTPNNSEYYTNIESQIIQENKEGATENMMEEYRSFIENYQKAEKKVIKMDEYIRIKAIYDLMTKEQNATVFDHNDIIKLPLFNRSNRSKIEPKKTTLKEFESWKNGNKFAIWIDGKHVPNKALNNYQPNDFEYFMGSFVHKNARSKRFPQEYQFSLYTKNGFAETFQEANVNNYKRLTQKYTDKLNIYLMNKNKDDHSELRILNSRLHKVYNGISAKQKSKFNILSPPEVPKLNMQEGATKEQINWYNSIIKKINEYSKSQRIYKQKDVRQLERIYNLMTSEQKKEAEVFPKFHSPPPMDTIYTYNRLAKRIKTIPKNRKANIIYLKEIYSKMNTYQKSKVEGPNEVTKRIVQEGATNSQIKEYNVLAKKYNEMGHDNMSIKKKEIERLTYIYNLMSDKQKTDVEPVLYFPPMPEPLAPSSAPKVKKGAKSNIPSPPSPSDPKEVVDAENIIKDIIENQDPYDGEIITLNKKGRILNVLQGEEYIEIENRITPTQPTKSGRIGFFNTDKKYDLPTSPPSNPKFGQRSAPPHLAPMVRKGEKSDIPPPPPQKTALDYVVEMAKKDATFIYEGKKISSDKAIAILKKSKKINLRTRHKGLKKPIVELSTKPIVIKN